MFKVEIKKNNIVTNQAKFLTEELAQNWLNTESTNGSFGKLEREVKEIALGVLDNNEDISKSISVREEVNELFGGIVVKFHTLPQEFTSTITDITTEHQAQVESQEALAYLASTDWYIIRELDSGLPCPPEIKDLRAAARLKVL
jgi:hypothetical protein